MRERLILCTRPIQVVGVFVAPGSNRHRGEAACFCDVRSRRGTPLADHVWVDWADALTTKTPCYGDRVRMTAMPRKYYTDKAYVENGVVCYGKCTDVCLTEPRGVRVLGNVLDRDAEWFAAWEDKFLADYLATENSNVPQGKLRVRRARVVGRYGLERGVKWEIVGN